MASAPSTPQKKAPSYRDTLLAWEEQAPVQGEAQLAALALFAEFASRPRPPPPGMDSAEPDEGEKAPQPESQGGTDDKSSDAQQEPGARSALLATSGHHGDLTAPQSKEDFHRWYEEVGTKVAAQKSANHEAYVQSVADYERACKQLVRAPVCTPQLC